jgi:hypothetical protein
MNRVPTKCVLGDFTDVIRDQYFINQYEKDGVMKVFRLKSIKDQRADLVDFLAV